MAKSARSSRIKKNNQALKKKVFGPVEVARNERLSSKLLDLANQPKPLRTEMEVETEVEAAEEEDVEAESRKTGKSDSAAEDIELADDPTSATTDSSSSTSRPSDTAQRKRKIADRARIEKKRHRRERNRLVFQTRVSKSGKSDGVGRTKKSKGKR